jgi:hypothetical protein
MSETKVQLVLRNPLDNKAQTPPGTSIAGLFGVVARLPAGTTGNEQLPRSQATTPAPAPQPQPAVKARPVAYVEVFRGVKKTEETFDLPTGNK